MKVKSESEVAQSCPTLRDPMDCSLPGSSIHGIFQARVVEWGAIAFSANMQYLLFSWGFPSSSVDEESTCNARDPSLRPGWGRSTGKGIGYPLQYSWAFLVSQLVKNPPTVQETWFGRSTGENWRSSSKRNEEAELKQKRCPFVDVSCGKSKTQCCQGQYCIGTWNVRSMNQGKLEVVK